MALTHLNKNIPFFANLEPLSYIPKSNDPFFNKLLYSFVASNYPCEILESRLYLGDHHHADDKTIL